MRGSTSFDGVLQVHARIHRCGIGGGRIGFVVLPQLASGTYASSRMTPPFVAHLMRFGGARSTTVLAVATA